MRHVMFVLLGLLIVSSAPARCGETKTKQPKKPIRKAADDPRIPPAEQLIRQLKPGHPRLLLDEAGFAELGRRVKTDPVLKDWDKQVLKQADKLLDAPLPKHVLPDGKRLLSTSRSVMDRTYTLGLMYRLHGDAKYADRLWQELKTVAEFPDWNPKHFLDTAEMTHAVAIGYDWLFEKWTDSQRSTLREAIVRHGLKPGLDVYRNNRWWASATHNWNQVCNGGMTVGALAIGDEEPALAGEVLRSAILSVPLAMHSYAPDGAWNEGPGYWAYATTYNVLMLAALESSLGTDFGLSKIEGFSQTGLFPIYMAGPTDRWFNFEDSGDGVGRSPCMLWLGDKFNLPACQWFAAGGRKPTAMAMIWYHGPGQDPQAAGLPLDKHWRGVDAVTMRSRWNDPKATFVGIQAGSNQVNHNHLDLGSFVLDALGQRFAVDLGADNYNLPGYFGGKRYDYYRLRAESHNTLVINPDKGPDQDVKSSAKIRRFVSNPERAFAIADLTPAYARHVRRVERGIATDRRQVLIQDEIACDTPADVWWFMHTAAQITMGEDGQTATLKLGDAALTARLLSTVDARFEIRPAGPLPTSPDPEGQRRNDGVRKLAIHLPNARDVRLAVILTPVDGQPTKTVSAVKPLADW